MITGVFFSSILRVFYISMYLLFAMPIEKIFIHTTKILPLLNNL